jgi:hypothetical protein
VFANRYTAFINACTLAGTLERNLLLTLAEAEFFRVRWSERVMDETEAAVARILGCKGVADAEDRAARARSADQFIADTIALDPGKAVAAIRRMRERFKRRRKQPRCCCWIWKPMG